MFEILETIGAFLVMSMFVLLLLSANIGIITIWIDYIKDKQWTFVPCASPSRSREAMSKHILEEPNGTQFKLTVNGNTFGYEYR